MGQTPEESHWAEKAAMVEGALGGSAWGVPGPAPFCHLGVSPEPVFLRCTARIPGPSVPHPPPPMLLGGTEGDGVFGST